MSISILVARPPPATKGIEKLEKQNILISKKHEIRSCLSNGKNIFEKKLNVLNPKISAVNPYELIFSFIAVWINKVLKPKYTKTNVNVMPAVPNGKGFQIEKAINIEKKVGNICGTRSNLITTL